MLVLTGPSGSGKDTVAKVLVEEYGYTRLLLHTTRPIRLYEKDGVDAKFIDDNMFQQMTDKNEFAVTQHFPFKHNGNEITVHYGLYVGDIKDKDSVFIISIDSIEELRTYCFEHKISIYVIGIYADKEELRRRLIKRDDQAEEIERRINSDDKKYYNMDDICDAVIDSTNYCADIIADQIEELYKAFEG